MEFHEITGAVRIERQRQIDKWGKQVHPNFLPRSQAAYQRLALVYKDINDTFAKADACTWDTILLEEFYEACESRDDQEIQKELIESIAVLYAWLENYRLDNHEPEDNKESHNS